MARAQAVAPVFTHGTQVVFNFRLFFYLLDNVFCCARCICCKFLNSVHDTQVFVLLGRRHLCNGILRLLSANQCFSFLWITVLAIINLLLLYTLLSFGSTIGRLLGRHDTAATFGGKLVSLELSELSLFCLLVHFLLYEGVCIFFE